MSYKYIKLWLTCFNLIRRREGFYAAYRIMYINRVERSESELEELSELLRSI